MVLPRHLDPALSVSNCPEDIRISELIVLILLPPTSTFLSRRRRNHIFRLPLPTTSSQMVVSYPRRPPTRPDINYRIDSPLIPTPQKFDAITLFSSFCGPKEKDSPAPFLPFPFFFPPFMVHSLAKFSAGHSIVAAG